MSAPVSSRLRLALSVSLALIAAGLAWQRSLQATHWTDVLPLWYAARALLHGVDPYPLVGPGRTFDFPMAFVYPLPSALAALPLAPFAPRLASAVFVGFGIGVLAWALMRNGLGPLVVLLAAPVGVAMETAQWSPLFAAALVLPALSFFLVAKPTIGLAIFAARPSWRPVVAGVLCTVVAFALVPGWLAEWRQALAENAAQWGGAPYRAPITLPGGLLALACLARWRRPEARLVVALACVPQTLWVYDTVPLLMVPSSLAEGAVLVVTSHAAWLWGIAHGVEASTLAGMARIGQSSVLALFLPATAMVLRRPNEGPVPAWLERRISVWPTWVRGMSAPHV